MDPYGADAEITKQRSSCDSAGSGGRRKRKTRESCKSNLELLRLLKSLCDNALWFIDTKIMNHTR